MSGSGRVGAWYHVTLARPTMTILRRNDLNLRREVTRGPTDHSTDRPPWESKRRNSPCERGNVSGRRFPIS